MIQKTKNALNTHYTDDENIVEVGVDEVGRGPLFGRVYTSAVILPKDKESDFEHSLMKDSKKFTSKKKIKEVADYIKENAIAWSVTYRDEKVIDEINILQATQESMHSSILSVLQKYAHENENQDDQDNINKNKNKKTPLLLIDGNYFKPITRFNKRTCKIENVSYVCIEKGDNKYSSIAAASILAKVARDEYIQQLCDENPDLIEKYGIDSNKGYGAKVHMEGIKMHGITIWHRRSFGICKQFI